MNKLFLWMKEDGMKHVIVSAFLCATLNLITSAFGAAFFTFVIGTFKEAYDYYSGKGCSEFKDIVCNLIGITISTIATI